MNNSEKKTTVFDVIASDTDGSGKTHWNQVGVAFPLKNSSGGFSMRLFHSDKWFVIKESLRPTKSMPLSAVAKSSETLSDNGSDDDPPF